jgi:hypothetical protein
LENVTINLNIRPASGAARHGSIFPVMARSAAPSSEPVNKKFTLLVQFVGSLNYGQRVLMKIAGTGPINPPGLRRREKARGTRESGFASELAQNDGPRGATATGQVESLGSLLAAQEVNDESKNGLKSAVDRAELLLDKLDQLRHGLLMGKISGRQLTDLMNTVRRRQDQFLDPRIREVLDQIELRAAVELAKLRKNR